MLNKRDRTLWAMAALWLLAASGALFAMADYGSQEGLSGTAPTSWPQALQTSILPDPARPTLVLFAHPLCPCTRSTLWELESITNRLYGMVDLHVLFFEPADTHSMPDIWAASDLKRLAVRLPGARLHTDVDGQIAQHFGAYTSGQVLLYGTDGALQFAGGITPSRGHTGANPGRAAGISAILSDKAVDPLAPALNPVFGCSIHENDAVDRKLLPEPLAMKDDEW